MGAEYEHFTTYWISRVHKTIELLREQALREIGVHRGQAAVLWRLRREDGVPQVSLSSSLRITRASITDVVARMETNGWVRRERTAQDRRVVRVFLTPRGRALSEELAVVLDEIEQRALSELGERDPALLLDGLRRIDAGLSDSSSHTESSTGVRRDS